MNRNVEKKDLEVQVIKMNWEFFIGKEVMIDSANDEVGFSNIVLAIETIDDIPFIKLKDAEDKPIFVNTKHILAISEK